MEVNSELVDRLVEQVVRQIESKSGSRSPTVGSTPVNQWTSPKLGSRRRTNGIFTTVNEAVAAASEAFPKWSALEKSRKTKILNSVRQILLQHVRELSEEAARETGLGRAEDKIYKNTLVITKTPGVEVLEPKSWTGESGLAFCDYAPYGVIASITPTTNPSETIINNGIGMLAAGNTVVFNAHPMAKGVSARTVEIMNEAIRAQGGPDHVLAIVETPTIETAHELMNHPGISLLVVTGGPQVVKVAMATGKKVIAAGPGNPPVVVDETADIDLAGKSIVQGASLDNNVVCIVEKECIVVRSVLEPLKASLQRYGAFHLSERQRDQLTSVIVPNGHVNKKFVGKDASVILREIGVNVGRETRLVTCDADENHPFVQKELLMPILPVVATDNFESAVQMAKRVEHGYRHTAVIHSKDISRIHRMGALMNCSIFVSNAPSYAGLGLGGEGYTSFTIASPTGEGLTTARHFTRERRFTVAGHLNMV